jgi:predicted ester cyclase
MIGVNVPSFGLAYTPILAFKSNHRTQPAFSASRSYADAIWRQEPEFEGAARGLPSAHGQSGHLIAVSQQSKGIRMSLQDDNKAVVGRWFTDFWGKTCNLSIVDEIAAPDMLLKYSLHEPRTGHADIKAFMADFRAAFPDLNFWGTADLIAEGDYVVGQWEGGGIHTGPAFNDFLIGGLPANTGRKMHFTGTTILKVKNGRILEEIGLDDGVTALTQLGLLRAV